MRPRASRKVLFSLSLRSQKPTREKEAVLAEALIGPAKVSLDTLHDESSAVKANPCCEGRKCEKVPGTTSDAPRILDECGIYIHRAA